MGEKSMLFVYIKKVLCKNNFNLPYIIFELNFNFTFSKELTGTTPLLSIFWLHCILCKLASFHTNLLVFSFLDDFSLTSKVLAQLMSWLMDRQLVQVWYLLFPWKLVDPKKLARIWWFLKRFLDLIHLECVDCS